jgi:hypothetical protein
MDGLYGVGAVYAFTADENGWNPSGKLVASDAAESAGFGSALALDGNRLVISAPPANDYFGEAYLFEGSHGTWSEAAQFTAGNGASFDNFGYAVALGGDTVFAGAPFASGTGAGYFYTQPAADLIFASGFE